MIKARSYVLLCACLSSFKLLLLRSYVSTDFDVHRNWMAITFNQPIKDWYFDTTSEWTLDYPPLFAAFELFLAFIAHTLNLTDALQLSERPIRSEHIVCYQKITVIASDCLYYFAVYKLCVSLQGYLPGPTRGSSGPPKAPQPKAPPSAIATTASTTSSSSSTSTTTAESAEATSSATNDSKKKSVQVRVSSTSPTRSALSRQSLSDVIYRPDAGSCIALLLLAQPGLLLVDHIHFQYNGFLSGVLLLSVARIIDGRMVEGSFWFAVLLNLKHIYLYCAPAIGMYLVVSYCMEKVANRNRIWTFITRAGRLGSVVMLVFMITYAPFCDQITMKQIITRLFPFKRGLTHAYWAPNFWSIYNSADKVLATVFKDSLKVNFDLESITKSRTMIKSTSGKVGEFEHQYLSAIKPMTTVILVSVLIIPVVIKFLLQSNRRTPRLFMKGLALTTFISFMFGWHVHEKAIILVLLPMVPLSFTDPQLSGAFLRLTLAGTYSLFPLVYEPAEYVTKLTLLVAYYNYARSHNHNKSIQTDSNQSNNGNNDQKLVEQQQQRQQQQSRTQKSKIRIYMTHVYNTMDFLFIVAIVINELYCAFLFNRLKYSWNPLAKLDRFAFLPLMTTSTLSALGISVSFLEIYYDFIITCSS